MSKAHTCLALAVWTLPCLFAADLGSQSISLSGEWRLHLDPTDIGITEAWFNNSGQPTGRIHLPGSTDEQHFGRKNDGREAGHLTRAYEYIGPAWYQREIAIPESWKGRRSTLFLERCHWETRAWLDAYPLGLQNSLGTPHTYELGEAGKSYVTPGIHRLTIRVDNRLRIDLGKSSAITEEGPGNWNGIAGRLELRSTDRVWIDAIYVYPHLAQNTAHVNLTIRNSTGDSQPANVVLSSGGSDNSTQVTISNRPVSVIEQDLTLRGPARTWSEFSPFVHTLAVSLASSSSDARFSDQVHTTFGMRELSTAGRQIKLNGQNDRGSGNCR